MPDTITKHSQTFTVRASEVGAVEKITLPALCALFQEVAGNHAEMLHFGIPDLHKKKLTWVLHRMDIQVERYPQWQEEITIETWPAAGDKLRAYRNYRVLDEEGNQIAVCLSYWMMINIETRKPARMPKEVLELRLADAPQVLPVKKDRLSPFEDAEIAKKFMVRSSDLDINEHVNNTRLIAWVMETFESEKAYLVKNLDILFLKEAKLGDLITSEQKNDERQTFRHQLKNRDGEVIALATSG